MRMGISLGLQQRGGGGASDAISDALATRAGIALKPWKYATTLFTDTAGTVAASAAGDIIAVAKCLDKGLQYQQTTLANRPILTRWPKSGKRNLLTWTEDFSNAVWAKSTASVTINAATAPDGTMTAMLITPSGANSNVRQLTSIITTGVSCTASFWARSVTGSVTTAAHIGRADFGSVTTIPLSLTTTWTQHSGTFVSVGTTMQLAFGGFSELATGEDIYIWHPQFELNTSATDYQKATIAQDITEAGQDDCWGLTFDGTNDGMATAATLNLSGSDAVGVFAGVTKLSDAAWGAILEHTASIDLNAGGVLLAHSLSADDSFVFESKGTALSTALANGYTAPQNAMLTGLGDISADTAILRRNGTQIATSAADQGTGNYSNATSYVGNRGNASLRMNGILWGSAIVSTLATTDTAEIAAIEAQIAANTPGVTL